MTATESAANPNQLYWDTALTSFNNGDTDVTAIQAVWEVMAPPGSLKILASIIGAIYADNYWALTKMDPNLLSIKLQAAGGWNKPDCDQAAAFAFQKWYGLLVRSNFADTGSMPKPDPVTSSPDVVANAQSTLSVTQMITQWNQYIYTIDLGLKNNVYGRAQSVNIQAPITNPQLRMFFSDAGFNPPPQSWIQMFTSTGSPTVPLKGTQTGPIPVGGRAASNPSFMFQPTGAGHYCLIAVASTEYFTNNPLDQTGNWNSFDWIHGNGAAGWHNVDVNSSLEESLKFYNQDGSSERFSFEAHCSNLPKGTYVTLECEDDKLAFPISSGDVKVTKGYQVISTEAEVPPNFAGSLKVRFNTPDGKLLPKQASVDVRMFWHVAYGHQHYVQAINHPGNSSQGASGHPARLPMGNFTFLGADR